MKNSIVNFTRGTQLLGHFGFMFAAGFKLPLIISSLVVLGTAWWQVSSALDDYQAYLLWMHLYASGYMFMEFDPAKLVNLRLPDGDMIAFPMAVVRNFPPMREAWDLFFATVKQAVVLSTVCLVPLMALFWWVAEHFGEKSKARRHLRGARLVSLPELKADIARHNRGKRALEYGRELGWKWRLAGRTALQEAGLYAPAHLAGVSYPWRQEQGHAMLVGTTGMGKTVALFELVDEIRQRGERVVIFDLTGAFIEAFYEPERDVILNPLDARCPAWSVFNDCTTSSEFHAAAESLVPHDGGGAEQFWVLAARTLFVETCLKLVEKGKGTNAALASDLMNANLSDLHQLLEDTMAGPMTDPQTAKMAESVRAVFNVNAKALQLLPTEGKPFSIRDWVKGGGMEGSFLFLSARYADLTVLSQMLTLWLDTAINTLMTGRTSSDLRLWFLIDELGALHRLPSLEKGLQTARNYGGAIVTGVHAYAKLKEVYGENMAMTLSSLAKTKLMLGTADRETATWCSDTVGHREVREVEENQSYGHNSARDAVSLTARREIAPLLLPDEFMGLKSLEGYIKFPEGLPTAPITLEPQDWPRIAEGFIPREIPKLAKPAARPVTGEPGDDDDSGHQGGESDDSGERRRRDEKHRAQQLDSDKEKRPNRGSRRKRARDRSSEEARDKHLTDERGRSGRSEDPAKVHGRADQEGKRQSELPLGTDKDRVRDETTKGRSAKGGEDHDPHRHKASSKGRNRADQERRQQGLLGGAAHDMDRDKSDRDEPDVGDIEPDI